MGALSRPQLASEVAVHCCLGARLGLYSESQDVLWMELSSMEQKEKEEEGQIGEYRLRAGWGDRRKMPHRKDRGGEGQVAQQPLVPLPPLYSLLR